MPNCDSVMEGVYATRQRISARYGHDPDQYIAAIRNKTAAANDLGISYLDYCVREVHSTTEEYSPSEASRRQAMAIRGVRRSRRIGGFGFPRRLTECR